MASSYSERKYPLSKSQRESAITQNEGEGDEQSPKQLNFPLKFKPNKADHKRSLSTRGPIPSLKLESLTSPHKDQQDNPNMNTAADFGNMLKQFLSTKSSTGSAENRRSASTSRFPFRKVKECDHRRFFYNFLPNLEHDRFEAASRMDKKDS